MGVISEHGFTRQNILDEARNWIGTPYHHQQHVKRFGCDCVGLVIGVHDALYKVSAGYIPPYTKWWAEETGQELMIETMRKHPHCVEVSVPDLLPGDVFVMRMKYAGPAKHCGFLSGNGQIIHAYSGHAVMETDIPPGWARRIRYGFRFADVVGD